MEEASGGGLNTGGQDIVERVVSSGNTKLREGSVKRSLYLQQLGDTKVWRLNSWGVAHEEYITNSFVLQLL